MIVLLHMKNNETTIKVDKKEDFIRIYKYVNFGDRVEIFGKEAVVVEFDPSCPEADTKVIYKDGGFDWVNRDDLEDEQVRLSGLTHYQDANQNTI